MLQARLSFQMPCRCMGSGESSREPAITRYRPYWKNRAASWGSAWPLRTDSRRTSVGWLGRLLAAQIQRHPAEQTLVVGHMFGAQTLPAFFLGGRHLAGAQSRRIAAPEVGVQSHNHRGGVGSGHHHRVFVGANVSAFGQHAEQGLKRNPTLAVAVGTEGVAIHQQRIVALAPLLCREDVPRRSGARNPACRDGQRPAARRARPTDGWPGPRECTARRRW